MPRVGRVLLVVLVLAAVAPTASQASTVEVRGGVLTVAQAPGEATTVSMLPVPGATGAWQVSAPRFPFGPAPPFDAAHQGVARHGACTGNGLRRDRDDDRNRLGQGTDLALRCGDEGRA